MIGNPLGDTRCLQPVFQRSLSEAVVEAHKDLVRRLTVLVLVMVAYQFQCLFTYWIIYQLLGLPHSQSNVHAAITIWLYLIPCQLLDITLSQSCQTRNVLVVDNQHHAP